MSARITYSDPWITEIAIDGSEQATIRTMHTEGHHALAETIVADHNAAADLAAARARVSDLEVAIASALYDLDHRDEISATDTLRSALAGQPADPAHQEAQG